MQENNGGKEKQGGLSWTTPATPHAHSTAPHKPAASPQKPAPSAAASSSAGKYIGMVVVGVLVGVIVAWGWNALRSGSSGSTASTMGGSSTTTEKGGLGVNPGSVPALGANPALSIMTPQPAGLSVAIDKAIVSAPTWIVIYENKDGKPGNALGAALFFPERQTGSVELLRTTVAGRSYLAVKQVDNGDRKFSLKDDQFVSEGGEVQWVTFEVR